MDEIREKLELIRLSGLTPLSVMMTQEFYDDLNATRKKVVVSYCESPVTIHGIPIKIKEPSHVLYSIEVA